MTETKTNSDPTKKVDGLKQDIDSIRGNLGGLIGELDRRRHEAFDLRLQIRRHTVPIIVGATALLALAGVAIAVGVRRRRQRVELPAKVWRLRQAVARMIANPDRAAKGGLPILGSRSVAK